MPSPVLRLRPSDASRWTTCTVSPIAIAIAEAEGRVVRTESAYAQEGIRAHELAASGLLLGKNFADDYGNDIELMRYVESFIQFCNDERRDAEQLVEHEVRVFYAPERKGFIDVAHVAPNFLQIIDLKYGQGVAINAFQNKQLAIYARSLYDMLASTPQAVASHAEVEIVIFQPRVREGEKLSRWRITVGELFKFTNAIGEVANTIQAAFDGSERHAVEAHPSESNCRFCPLADGGWCRAHAAWLLGDEEVLAALAGGADPEVDGSAFDMLDGPSATVGGPDGVGGAATLPDGAGVAQSLWEGVLPAPATLPPALRATLVRRRTLLNRWLGRLADYTRERLLAGHRDEAPGLKLVRGRAGNRYWTDPEAAARLLGRKLSRQERFVTSVITPAQADELLKAHDLSPQFERKLAELTCRKSADLTVVPVDDPRPEADGHAQAELEFEDLDADEKAADNFHDMLE